ncbi:MAG: hypothetical protein BWY91_02536 [bacterium ADurb.BinA028]|jgi:hypothetical protein|nr:MAG: hypothetical protein BWY91_02536 [bacterium ADurb.BinA028]
MWDSGPREFASYASRARVSGPESWVDRCVGRSIRRSVDRCVGGRGHAR